MCSVLLPVVSRRSVSISLRVRSPAAGEAGFCTVRVRSRCAHSIRRGSQYSPRKIASMPLTSVSSELSVKNTPFTPGQATTGSSGNCASALISAMLWKRPLAQSARMRAANSAASISASDVAGRKPFSSSAGLVRQAYSTCRARRPRAVARPPGERPPRLTPAVFEPEEVDSRPAAAPEIDVEQLLALGGLHERPWISRGARGPCVPPGVRGHDATCVAMWRDCARDGEQQELRLAQVEQHKKLGTEIATPLRVECRDKELDLIQGSYGWPRGAGAVPPRIRLRGRHAVTRTIRRPTGCHVQPEIEGRTAGS